MEKAQRKKEERLKKQLQEQKRKKRTRVAVWTLSVLLVVLIAALAVFWPKPGPLKFDYGKVPTLGSADAKVKIMEFGDFKCPTCAYFSQDIMSKIKAEYIDTGKVSLSYQNWTIISEDSYTAALAGLSIYHQSNEAFWKFYDALYQNQPAERLANGQPNLWATPEFLVDFAKKLGLEIDYDKLKSDIVNQTYRDELDAQNRFAQQHKQFTGTPTVFLNGVQAKEDTAFNYDKFKAAIDKALQEAGA